MRVSLLTGGDDPNYAVPLAESLSAEGIEVEFIGNDSMAAVESLTNGSVKYLNLRGNQDPQAPTLSKIARILRYYKNLISYTCRTESRLFHILWLNRFEVIDRTVMNVLYKLKGKTIVFTAHNVNSRKRDGVDSWTNRMALRAMYSMLDHIFVHTDLSKEELVHDYGVAADKVTVIPFGLNTYVPETRLSRSDARASLALEDTDKVLLFFGQIAPYKGLDILLDAFKTLSDIENIRLIIAGPPKRGAESYWQDLKSSLEAHQTRSRVLLKDEFIPDSDVSVLFRAADALVLPYHAIYQSGPLSLAYRFGVPVIATRVGSFQQDVIPRVTGLLCEPDSALELANAIREYFRSELYSDEAGARARITQIASERYSWKGISQTIVDVYTRLERAEGVAC